jgi:hypothetical protein
MGHNDDLFRAHLASEHPDAVPLNPNPALQSSYSGSHSIQRHDLRTSDTLELEPSTMFMPPKLSWPAAAQDFRTHFPLSRYPSSFFEGN